MFIEAVCINKLRDGASGIYNKSCSVLYYFPGVSSKHEKDFRAKNVVPGYSSVIWTLFVAMICKCFQSQCQH